MNLSETAEVLAAMDRLRAEQRSMALATIVGVSGSTYRRPGARLLVPEHGVSVGNLSGGCLEGEVEAIARDVMRVGRPRLELFDLTADDEIVWGWGLGCNGAIEVFVEPGDQAARTASALREAIEHRQSLVALTVISSSGPGVEVGARLVAFSNGGREGTLGSDQADDAALQAASHLERSGPATSRVPVEGGEVRVFVERLEPPSRLIVCGAGHDAVPLVRLASSLGWVVDVVDDRAPLLTPERFPEASGFVGCEPSEVVEKAAVEERSYVVVMSHNYLRDRDYLRALVSSRAAYIGMLGPRARTQRLLEELAREGIEPSEGMAERIHGPAGLDVGAEGPEEIAAAIVAEVLAVQRGRAGGYLKDRAGSIHDGQAMRG